MKTPGLGVMSRLVAALASALTTYALLGGVVSLSESQGDTSAVQLATATPAR